MLLVFTADITESRNLNQVQIEVLTFLAAEFLYRFQELYTKRHSIQNIYTLKHLYQSVRNYSQLSNYLTFNFEDERGQIVSTVRGIINHAAEIKHNLNTLKEGPPAHQEIKVKEITKSLQTRLDSMMKEDKKATEEFASDPNVIVVKRTKKRRRVVPLPSATSTDTTPSAYPESLPHSAPSENVSNAAERYACSFAFPPIKIIPLTTNNQMPNLTGPIVTRFLDEFRLPDVAESNIAYWRIRSGNLLFGISEKDSSTAFTVDTWRTDSDER
ncbi:unnamed protein product [Didymodactylos carnosus]|uniref:Uncharacterized protein n=1 Tax=Didymodactylos carnosus TaxID=1234261 RepID=A0A815UEC4_9BILA|nr:unnamed protein product [Didymodactylos carnosus]CAF4379137.1 unnamed protein product [Didymodactylos carnosus]